MTCAQRCTMRTVWTVLTVLPVTGTQALYTCRTLCVGKDNHCQCSAHTMTHQVPPFNVYVKAIWDLSAASNAMTSW